VVPASGWQIATALALFGCGDAFVTTADSATGAGGATTSQSSAASGGGTTTTGTGGSAGNGGGGGGPGGGLVIASGPFGDVEAVAELNTAFDEDDPTFTADGLELYFNSNRNGLEEIFQSNRGSLDDPWGAPTPVAVLSEQGGPTNPVVSPDGLKIWVAASGPSGGDDVWVSSRTSRSDPWPSLVHEPAFSSNQQDAMNAVDASLTLALVSDNPPGGGGTRLAQLRRNAPSEPWGGWEPVPGLNGSYTQAEAWMSPDGLYIYMRGGGGGAQIKWASRATVAHAFGMFTPLPELETMEYESDAWLLPDQSYIMFSRGTAPARDIYQASR
jgi:hypothetical protein